jgi:hypothetical protein
MSRAVRIENVSPSPMVRSLHGRKSSVIESSPIELPMMIESSIIESSMIARSQNRRSRHPARGAGRNVALACAVALTLFTIVAVCERTTFAADKAVLWKVSDQALLRVDDHPVKGDWNIYQEGKKTNPLLLQMGTRFLLVDGRGRQIFEIDPASIAHRGTELSWDPANHPAKALATSEWIVRDVGLAYKISARLVAENHLMDLQIPHPIDVRPLSH